MSHGNDDDDDYMSDAFLLGPAPGHVRNVPHLTPSRCRARRPIESVQASQQWLPIDVFYLASVLFWPLHPFYDRSPLCQSCMSCRALGGSAP